MRRGIVFGLLAFAAAQSSSGQDTLFFRGFRGQEYLVLSSNRITLELADTSVTPDVLKASYPELVLTGEPDRVSRHLFVLAVRGGTDFDLLLSRLNSDERVAFAVPCAISKGGYDVYLDNRIFILLQSPLARPAMDALLADMHLNADPPRQDHPEMIRAKMLREDLFNYRQLLDTLSRVEAIRSVIPVYWSRDRMFSTPNDPYWTEQAHLWWDELNLERAFDFCLRPDSVSIHFFDDGVDIHEDFPQPFSIKGRQWHHYNDTLFEVYLTSKHGMGTTGVAYARIGNALGIAGFNNANFKVRVQQICVSDPYAEGVMEFVDHSVIMEAIIYSAMNGADIINHSWGAVSCEFDDPGGPLSFALDSAYKLGVLTVASSGNCSDTSILTPCACVHLPAKDPHVVAVGGLSMTSNQRDPEASYGPELDVITYSIDVPTLSLTGTQARGANEAALTTNCDLLPVNYRCMTGTSISSPQAAAIAGLVLAKRPDFKNKPDTLAKILRYSTDDGAAPCALDTGRHNDEIGYGRLDAYRALHSVSRGNVDNTGIIDLTDLSYFINYLTSVGPPPQPDLYIGDLNCDCSVNMSDLSLLVMYLTQNVPIPLCFKFPN